MDDYKSSPLYFDLFYQTKSGLLRVPILSISQQKKILHNKGVYKLLLDNVEVTR